MNNQQYILDSIRLNLFFSRIMKEHALFIELALTNNVERLKKEAATYRHQFEELLNEVTKLANGNIDNTSLNANMFTTPYTLSTEKLTEYFTGIPIDTELTKQELSIVSSDDVQPSTNTTSKVEEINDKAKDLVTQFIQYKTNLLAYVLDGRVFTSLYPNLINHILDEAKYYYQQLSNIQDRLLTDFSNIKNNQLYFNEFMEGHAKTIRGLLDPSEQQKINNANEFAQKYAELIKKTAEATPESIDVITNDNATLTNNFKDFKTDGVKLILDNNLLSIIIPLLADHLLREANYYLYNLSKVHGDTFTREDDIREIVEDVFDENSFRNIDVKTDSQQITKKTIVL